MADNERIQAGLLSLLALGAILSFSAVGTLVGVRLLLLARRTREVPELALGLCLVMIATFGYPLSLVSLGFQEADAGLRALLNALTTGSVDLGIVSVLVFNAVVFRAQSGRGWAAVWAGGAGLLVLLVCTSVLVARSPDAPWAAQATRPLTVAFFAIAVSAFGWSALEALGWYRRLRRRLALGLSDAGVVDRFRLWTVWGFSMTMGSVINLVFTAAGQTIHHPVPLFVTAVCGFVNAGALLLAFFAPRSYRARVARRAV